MPVLGVSRWAMNRPVTCIITVRVSLNGTQPDPLHLAASPNTSSHRDSKTITRSRTFAEAAGCHSRHQPIDAVIWVNQLKVSTESRLRSVRETRPVICTSRPVHRHRAQHQTGILPPVDMRDATSRSRAVWTGRHRDQCSGVFAAGDVADNVVQAGHHFSRRGCMAALDAEKYLEMTRTFVRI